ncbi:Transglutaminase-like superfamily-domain-containing protein [Paraphysoderma sedebokerense]|nr:Transglutaminase-like superfamily-domain-containing protein [Paraphysoderma sedebokerense]
MTSLVPLNSEFSRHPQLDYLYYLDRNSQSLTLSERFYAEILIKKIHYNWIRAQWVRFVSDSSAFDLLFGFSLINALRYLHINPQLIVETLIKEVESFVSKIQSKPDFTSASLTYDKVIIIADYLFKTLAFQGNTERYYSIKNSYLHEILINRTGIPITLSILFQSVCKRLGVNIDMIGFPSHFLTRFIDDRESSEEVKYLYLDTFNYHSKETPAVLTREDCMRMFPGGIADFHDDFLAPASDEEVYQRGKAFNDLI